jgi:hypothetical protein
MSSTAPPTPAQIAGAIIELLVQRGVRVVHVDEETATMNAQTKELIEPPLLSGRDLALGKRRWWAAEHKLTERVMIPNEIANRRNSIFFWSYAYDATKKEVDTTVMYFLVRDPPRPTNAELSDEISRRFNILTETTLPALQKNYKALETRVKRLEDMWTKAPDLVYRPEEDDIVICTNNRLNAPPAPLYREAEEKAHEELQEEKMKQYEDLDEHRKLNVRLVEYLKKVDVRLTMVEAKVDDQKRLWEAMTHLQEQMKAVFDKMGIKTLDKKPPAQPPKHANGKLPVKKSKESPV